jgi:hypothetical protein
MSIPRSVTEILRDRVTLEVEGIDRLYLNVYVPRLQSESGVAAFFRFHRGHAFASSALMDPISKTFIGSIEDFAEKHQIPVVSFKKGQRKDDVAAEYRAGFAGEEGVLFIGKAQEKVPVFRTEKRRNPQTGGTYPWIVRSTGLVNQYYFYCIDRDFGPFFLKVCSYFPYNGKLCINGHEYAKQQLCAEGIDFEALDNGILRCADPVRLQAICDGLCAEKIDGLARKWFRILPHPFTAEDRQAGYRYDLSILQAELSLTQVLDQPVTGRIFFEEVIRENLDLGRPEQVQLIFDRKVTRKTPGRFQTRVITAGVIPSLHINYKSSRIKQYYKQGRALRTETTINNPRDFKIGKRLHNLPALRKIGFQANRRLLDVQTVSHDCTLGQESFERVVRPLKVRGQRVAALRFDDRRVQALFGTVVQFVFQVTGFANKDLRAPLAHLLGTDPEKITPGRMSYDLRRLRLHGLIERIPKTHRYQLTPFGLRTAFFFSRSYTRLLRPALAGLVVTTPPDGGPPLRRAFDRLEQEIARYCEREKLATAT